MKRLSFIPQLDSFRFFAVLLVMISHWLPKYDFLPFAPYGVIFFFVLSGYLITSNLLYLKQSIDKGELSIPSALKYFYIRRTLRIFPLYYLVIALAYLFIRPLFEGHILWYVTYLPNFLIFRQQYWPDMLSHFWSLGVEEQFYLLWPFLIFLVKEQRLRHLFIFIILLSITFKVFVYFDHTSYGTVLPWANFDAFGVGAILAYFPFSGKRSAFLEKIPFLLLCITLSIVAHLMKLEFLLGITISGCAAFIILHAQKNFTGLAGKIVDRPELQYLGKISYGLYVYHNFMPWLWRCLTGTETRYPLPIALFTKSVLQKPVIALSAQFILLIGISSLSWYLFEKPINDLKNALKTKPSPIAG